MDEPTNHLDINAMEVIENALLSFEGTVIVVSHDRYLLKKVPTAILELTENGIVSYLGNYDYYEEKNASIGSANKYIGNLNGGQAPAAADKQQRIAQREAEKAAALAQRKAEKAKARLEEEIAAAEAEVKRLEDELCRPEVFGDPAKAGELSKALNEAKELVDSKYSEWYNL